MKTVRLTLLRSSSLFLSILSLAISAERLLPLPSGPYSVLYNAFDIADASRIDPLDPDNGTRRLMFSSFYPVERSACSQTCTIPYISPNAAPYIFAMGTELGISSDELGQIAFQVCCTTAREASRTVSDVPLVFLLHGLGGTRLLHSALAQELASEGFAVLTMDHTFESIAVEFPDGSVVPGLNASDPTITDPERLDPLHQIRIDDVRFAVSRLASKEVAAKVAPDASCGFNTSRVVALGHSFGGSASIQLLMLDSRFVGGLNLDGNQHGNISDAQQPAVLVGAAGATAYPHNSTTDPSWAETLRHLKGWKAEIGVTDMAHMGFTDLAYLSGIGALTLEKEVADPLVGSLDGRRSFEIVSTYVKEFLGFVLDGKNTTLFDMPSPEFPEVVVV
ncbi:PAF acetylhydrolase [Paraphaeosphaeria sporulosa]